MKKLKKVMTAFMAAAVAAISVMSLSVFAEGTETFTAEVNGASEAKVDNGNRQQSFTVEFTVFDPTRLTKDSVVEVTYDITDDKGGKGDKVELVAQKYPDEQRKEYKGKSGTNPKADSTGAVWQIVKADSDDGKGNATFTYDSIVKAFGTDDFTTFDKFNVEAASESTIKCTGFKITNVKPESEGTHPKISSGIAWYWIVIAVAAAVIIVIVIVFVILNKKSDKAFDVSTGEFIDKKNVNK